MAGEHATEAVTAVGAAATRLGPYRLLHTLGEGGMGVVHLGLDRAGRAVAVKVLRAHIAHDPDARARLRREVSSLRRVQHPLVAEVIDADVDGERPYVVTRFVPGPGLDVVVRDEGALSAGSLTLLGRGLSQALGAIHQAGVVHRDLKPGNVLLLDGKPVVIDFGIAHVADDVRLTSTGLVMGTPGYLSPEVIDGAQVGTATDWWGWAATLAFAASGRPPFGRGPMDVVIDRVCRGAHDLEGVDPRLRPLLVAALDVDPARRPGADEVLHALDRYAAGEDAAVAVSTRTTMQNPVVSLSPATAALPRTPSTAALPRESLPHMVFGAAAPVSQGGLAPYEGPTLEGGGSTAVEQAAPLGDVPSGPRPRRTGTLLAILAALVGAAVAWPVVTAAVALVLMVLARTIDRSGLALSRRRHERGVRRTDVLVATLASPWHVLGGLVATAFAVLLPAVLGLATAFSAGLLVTKSGGSPNPTSVPAVGAGALMILLTSWWGAGGAALRRGSRVAARGLVPNRGELAVVLLLLAVAVVGALWALRTGHSSWWPVRVLPFGLRLP